MSAEPHVLLEFEAEYIGERVSMRLVRDDATEDGDGYRAESLLVLRDGVGWVHHVSENALDVAVGLYEAMRAKCEAECPSEATTPEQDRERDAQDQEQFGELFAMRAREVRE